MKVFSKKNILILVVILLLVVAGGTTYYFYNQNKKAQELLKEPGKAAQKEIDDLVKKVGKIFMLPSDETPTVATVSDEEKLSGEAFFAKAKNGDKILIYTTAKKAILYRPSINKVIEVAPVTAEKTVSPTVKPKTKTKNITPTVAPTVKKTAEAIKVAIYNGTMVKGLTSKYQALLMDVFTDIEVVKRADAKGEYEESVLVNISGLSDDQIEIITGGLELEVGKLPRGESKPKGVDLLIILGEDKADL